MSSRTAAGSPKSMLVSPRGVVVPVLEAFEAPPLGIHAVLPSNRYLPHRLRVLIDFLAAELGRS